MQTIRQHLEYIRDYNDQNSESGNSATYYAAVEALKVLDASSTLDGAMQTDVYRVIADDPHRAPERIAR